MKVKIKKLPKGFKVSNGKVVRSMSEGGDVNNTLSPISRDMANLEAEKGETALTDLTNDGSFELYNIGGKRHTEGGTPLNLPEQSFVFSDTRKMLLSVEELKSLGIDSKKKMTPADASKKFPLNKYIGILEDENSDKVSIDTAEEMINKNKIKLSQIAFIQESKKDFSDGLPLASYPFLVSKGINPQEMEAKIEEKNNPQQGPMHQMPDGSMMPGATHGEAPPQMSQQQMAMGPQQGLQEFTGPPQGGMPPMGKYGTELPSYQKKGEMPANEKMLMNMRKLNLELEQGILPSDIDSVETVRYMQEIVPKLKKAGYSSWDVIRYLEKNRPDLIEYNPSGAVKNIKGWEGVKKSGLPNKMKYGGALPKYQSKGQVVKSTASTVWNGLKGGVNYINPFKFNPIDNMWFSKGATTDPMMEYKFNLGDNNLGLLNTNLGDQAIFTNAPDGVENVKVWPQFESKGLSTQLYDRALTDANANNPVPGLISGDQSINPMESPEKTIGMWKYFDKEILEIKPWELRESKLWTDGNMVDFNQYLKMGEDGKMVYNGPKVRLKGLNEAGKKKVAESEAFFKSLQSGNEGQLSIFDEPVTNTSDNFSPIFNYESKFIEGTSDYHSPFGRSIMNKFKTSFGREPIIGNGKKLGDYNKASLYTLLGLGTFMFFNQDKIDNTKEEEKYNEWKKQRALEMGMTVEEYDIWIESDSLNKMPTDPKKFKIEDSLEKGIDIYKYGSEIPEFLRGGGTGSEGAVLCDAYDRPIEATNPDNSKTDYGMPVAPYAKYGGSMSPFKSSSLRKFTGGGDANQWHGGNPNEGLMYGAAPSGTVQGGMLNEVNIFADDTTQVGPGERMLMDMSAHRRQLMQKYSGIQEHINKNPNVLEDPEQSVKIQEQIQTLEAQLNEIDQKTSSIEQSLMQQRMQIDPFTEQSMQQEVSMKYGGGLPKYQNGSEMKEGETYEEYIKRTGNPVDPEIPKDAIYSKESNSFKSTESIEREREPSESSSFTWRDEDNNEGSPNPYYNDREDNSREYINGVLNPNYDPAMDAKFKTGADKHDAFYQIMNSDDFANVRKKWIEQTQKAIKDNDYGKSKGAKTTEGKAALAELQNMSEQDLFKYFNQMNQQFQMAKNSGIEYKDFNGPGSEEKFRKQEEANAKALGLPVPSRGQMMAYQLMYSSLSDLQAEGSAEEKALLSQVNLTYGSYEGGHKKSGKGNVSIGDGFSGNNSADQYVGVADNIDNDFVIKDYKVKCKGEYKLKKQNECLSQSTAEKTFKFNDENCECTSFTIPGIPPPVEKPRYETFDQDDLAVQVKSGQFPKLLNPTRQQTPDPAMVDPMYVDPRQQLSTLEATAASALRAGANASDVFGSMQDASEGVINKHEALNTKIYNNAMNVNVGALNEFTGNKMINEKKYMDESAMALGNYQTEYKDAEDALLNAEQTQMSNADEMYIRNLENPNYWFSPKRHNIEFYNDKNVDGTITPGPMTAQEASDWCLKNGMKDGEARRKCINDRMGQGGRQDNLNVTPPAVEVSLGTEVKGFSKRQADLQRSRKKLNKWITGH